MDGPIVARFLEKPAGDGAWINGGFFVLVARVLDHIDGDATDWERHRCERLAADGELRAFNHTGFWQPMDTLRDKKQLEDLWASGKAALESLGNELGFWKGRRVFLTGHTGFKGSWLALWLQELGAEVHGYALAAYRAPRFHLPRMSREMGDQRSRRHPRR